MRRKLFNDFVYVSPKKRETLTKLHIKPLEHTTDLKQVSSILQKQEQTTKI